MADFGRRCGCQFWLASANQVSVTNAYHPTVAFEVGALAAVSYTHLDVYKRQHLSFAVGRYGKPDIVRADGPHMSAIWCERGDKKCGADGYRQRLVLNWNPSPNRSSHGSGYIVWERAHRYDGEYEDDYAAIAERDPAKGQMLFKQCMYATDTFLSLIHI